MFNTKSPALEAILNRQFLDMKREILSCGSREEANKKLDTFFDFLGEGAVKVEYFLEANSTDELVRLIQKNLPEKRAAKQPRFEDVFGRFSVREESTGVSEDLPPEIQDILGKVLGQFSLESPEEQAVPPSDEEILEAGNTMVRDLMDAIPEGSEDSDFKMTVQISGKGATLIGKFLEDRIRKGAEIFPEVCEDLYISLKVTSERRIG